MSEIKFPSNAEVFIDELKNLQLFKDTQINNTIKDLAISETATRKGIVQFCSAYSNNFCIEPGVSSCHINVGANCTVGGIGYTGDGKRVAITANQAYCATWCGWTPSSPICPTDPYGQILCINTGNLNVPIACGCNGCGNSIWADYTPIVNTTGQTVQTQDGQVYLVEYCDGYQIIVSDATGCTVPYPTPAGHPNAFYLGYACISGAGVMSVFNDETNRRYLRIRGILLDGTWPTSPSATVTFQDHICHQGSNPATCTNPHGISLADLGINPDENAPMHQAFFHEKSIMCVNPASVCTAFYPTFCNTSHVVCLCGFEGS